MQEDYTPPNPRDDLPTTPSYEDAMPGNTTPTNAEVAASSAATSPDVAAAAPTAARGRANWTPRAISLAIVAAVVVLALVVTGVVFAANHSSNATPPTAAQIIASATKANLQDTAYTIQDNTTINFSSSATSSTPTTINISGTGKLTKTPARNDVTLTIPLIGTQNPIEGLTDGATLYLNVGTLGGLLGNQFGSLVPAGKWLEVPLGQTPNVLDYSRLTNLKVVGSDTVNGKATWHLQGTVNAPTSAKGSTTTTTTTATEDLWFFQDTYFPAKFVINASGDLSGLAGMMGGKTSNGATPSGATSTATVSFTSWNTGLTITPPAPSQVVSLPSNIPGLTTPTP
jgi:hypothetical protein